MRPSRREAGVDKKKKQKDLKEAIKAKEGKRERTRQRKREGEKEGKPRPARREKEEKGAAWMAVQKHLEPGAITIQSRDKSGSAGKQQNLFQTTKYFVLDT